MNRPSFLSRHKPLSLLLSGCAVLLAGCLMLPMCVLVAGAADAGYWWSARRSLGSVVQVQAPDSIRAETAALPAGNAGSGEQIFTGSGSCSACHSLSSSARIVGPSLSGIASRAATLKPTYSAEMYLYESIVSPKAYVVSGFQSDIMPENFKQRLSKQQIADLVAFLMTQ